MTDSPPPQLQPPLPTAHLPGEASSSSLSGPSNPASAPRRRVQLVGAPPTGPPIPKDDSHSDDDDDDHHDADLVEDDQQSDEDIAENSVNGDGSEDGEQDMEDLLANFADGETSLELTHLSLKTKDLRQLNLSRFSSHLESICLRQNLISKLSPSDIGSLSHLIELDLYDNALEKTYGEVLAQGCPDLVILDYSFNSIRHISHLAPLGKLKTLYFVQNKIAKVRDTDFDGPIANSLRSLELGGNKLRRIEGLERLTHLEELWLGKNKIETLENLDRFTSLRILSIQSNRLTKLENLDCLTNLEELYVSHNGLQAIEGLTALKKLRVLDVGGNKIEMITGLEGLKELEEFWANDNLISTFTNLEEQLGPKACPKLETIYLEGNPVQRKEGSGYRRKIILTLTQVVQIDATFVKTSSLR